MNDDRLAQLERDNEKLARALRRTLEEIFTEDRPGRYSVPVEFDGGDGICSIVGDLSDDACQMIEDAYLALSEAEDDGDSE